MLLRLCAEWSVQLEFPLSCARRQVLPWPAQYALHVLFSVATFTTQPGDRLVMEESQPVIDVLQFCSKPEKPAHALSKVLKLTFFTHHLSSSLMTRTHPGGFDGAFTMPSNE
jgi:hypothetical protein